MGRCMLLVLVLANICLAIDMPMFLWSGRDFFAHKQLIIGDTVQYSCARSILTSIVDKDGGNAECTLDDKWRILPKEVANGGDVEVLFGFVVGDLRTDQLSQFRDTNRHFLDMLSDSKTSIVVPFLNYTLDESVPDTRLRSTFEDIGQSIDGEFIVVGMDSSDWPESSASTKIRFVQSVDEDDQIFSNKKLDFLLVFLNNTRESTKSKINQGFTELIYLDSLLKSATDGNYIGFFIPQTASTPSIPLLSPSDYSSFLLDTVFHYTWDKYFPVWFWTSGLFLLFGIGLLFIVVRFTSNIMVPEFFLTKKK